jgi:hypothetical protein
MHGPSVFKNVSDSLDGPMYRARYLPEGICNPKEI